MTRVLAATAADSEEGQDFQPLEDADDRYMARMMERPRLVVPTLDEMDRVLTNPPCKLCEMFDYRAGQEQIVAERFWERLRREEKWQTFDSWINRRDNFGVCHAWTYGDGGLRLVDGDAPGYARASDLDSSVEHDTRPDKPVKCPHYRPRWSGRQKRTKKS